MCGILGYKFDGTNPDLARRLIEALLVRSQMRGCHATGICFADAGTLRVYKQPISATEFIRTNAWQLMMLKPPQRAILHTRYSTSGDWQDNDNNQPLIADDLALVHNGLVSMATKPEFEQQYGVRCATENDSEIILRKIQAHRSAGATLREAAFNALHEIDLVERPIFAIGLLTADGYLTSFSDGVRPIYRFKVPALNMTGFCSTKDIFDRAMKDANA